MKTTTLKVKRETTTARLPLYMTSQAAGADLFADLGEGKEEILKPGESRLISTGLSFDIPEGFEIQIRPRSGLARHHAVTVLNAPATIDADYKGVVSILLINHGTEDFVVDHHERIAQMVLARCERADFVEVNDVGTSDRGTGGFGHTGR